MTKTVSISADLFGLRRHAYGVWDNSLAARIVDHDSIKWCEDNGIKDSFSIVDSTVEQDYRSASGCIYTLSHPERYVDATFDSDEEAMLFKLAWMDI